MLTTSLEIHNQKTPHGNNFSMIYIEGGSFDMGSNEREREQPIHKVEISSFWMGQHQVSQELWEVIMGKNPSRFKGTNLPVEEVSWEDIQIFLEKLNQKLALTGDQEYRLPTEAEWEYAARGGKYGLKTRYAGSGNIDKIGIYWENSHSETQQLGLKVPNELGLYDMSGNIWEWCQDRYGNYLAGPLKDPKGPKTGVSRVLRGGSWGRNERSCRVSGRPDSSPDGRSYGIGFRLSRTAW